MTDLERLLLYRDKMQRPYLDNSNGVMCVCTSDGTVTIFQNNEAAQFFVLAYSVLPALVAELTQAHANQTPGVLESMQATLGKQKDELELARARYRELEKRHAATITELATLKLRAKVAVAARDVRIAKLQEKLARIPGQKGSMIVQGLDASLPDLDENKSSQSNVPKKP